MSYKLQMKIVEHHAKTKKHNGRLNITSARWRRKVVKKTSGKQTQ